MATRKWLQSWRLMAISSADAIMSTLRCRSGLTDTATTQPITRPLRSNINGLLSLSLFLPLSIYTSIPPMRLHAVELNNVSTGTTLPYIFSSVFQCLFFPSFVRFHLYFFSYFIFYLFIFISFIYLLSSSFSFYSILLRCRFTSIFLFTFLLFFFFLCWFRSFFFPFSN